MKRIREKDGWEIGFNDIDIDEVDLNNITREESKLQDLKEGLMLILDYNEDRFYDDENAHLEILGFEIVTSGRFSARPEVPASINCNWLCLLFSVAFGSIWLFLSVFGWKPSM